ncbi:MAG: electron transfer flavoprotein subunit beta/FixA family protein [Candidatus Marinimicrobia bacterium]|nr:electron transfer flavoprotein subunit beta/FixA family protein [Candidatus Neomarinimicrobiota bacterium]
MKICVLMKQVPDKDAALKIDATSLGIDTSDLTFVTNESDSYALEEALLLKEAHGGEVVACTLGADSSLQVVKDALSKGADRGLFLRDDAFNDLDILSLSKVFGAALKDENFDLIFSGLQSDDVGNGQLGLLIAEHLNTSHASLVMETEMVGDSAIKAKRELESGWFQWTELDFPASLTIQSGINTPRYASLRGIMMMKKKTIDTKSAEDLGLSLTSKTSTTKMYIPEKTKETVYVDGTTDEIVSKLVDIFANDIKVL